MAKQFINSDVNPKGFLIIEATAEEFVEKCNFDINGNIVCDDCAHVPDNNEKCYYLAVRNCVLCRDCLEHIMHVCNIRYPEHVAHEVKNFNKVATNLCIPTIEY